VTVDGTAVTDTISGASTLPASFNYFYGGVSYALAARYAVTPGAMPSRRVLPLPQPAAMRCRCMASVCRGFLQCLVVGLVCWWAA
jgi:hypothetical protein